MLRSTLHIEVHSCASSTPSADSVGDVSQPVLDFIASDESLDRYDEIISASGWRLEAYRRNPVFQNAHQYGDILFTIGKALVTEVRSVGCGPAFAEASSFAEVSEDRTAGKVRNGDQEMRNEGSTGPRGAYLFQRIQFATDVNPIARIAYGLYKGKFLNAVSVGFIPLRWLDGQGVEHTAGRGKGAGDGDSRSLSLRGGESGSSFRRRYLEQELLEVSAVGIPANPNALVLGLKEGAIEKSDLREWLTLLKSICADSPQRNPSPRHLEFLFLARELRRLLSRA